MTSIHGLAGEPSGDAADAMASSCDAAVGAPPPAGGASGDESGVHGGQNSRLTDPMADRCLERLLEGLDGLSAREPWQLSDDDLAALVQHSEVGRRRLLMLQVAVAVEAGKRGLPRQAGFGPGRGVKGGDTAALAAWVRSLVNVSRGQARQVAEVGAALFTDPVAAELAQTRAGALSGQITARHVSVIAEAVTRLSPPIVSTDIVDEETRHDAQKLLVEHAAVLDPVQTNIVAKRTVAVLDPHAGERLAKDEDLRDLHRGLSFSSDGSGLVQVRGTLTPRCAGLLATAIDAASAPRPAADGTPDPRTAAMRRHDGLQHVLGQVVAADGLLPSTHGSPYRLVVTVPHATLTAALTTEVAHAAQVVEGTDMVAPVLPGLLPDGFPLSPLTVQTMACGADVVPVLVDADHQPLDVGDTQYAFTPKIRTAVIARDGGCTYPGCGAPAPWCDIHHLIPFSRGGPTSVDNGALLCGRHHRYVHALNLTGRVVTRDGTSHVQWDHRPTSWTATTDTTATASGRQRLADGGSDTANEQPPLTDRCLDQLIQRWQRRRARSAREAA